MSLDWWVTHNLDKVFPESERPLDPPVRIALKAARGEIEDAQFAIRPQKGNSYTSAQVTAKDLVSAGGCRIPASAIRVCWEWYVYVTHNPPWTNDPSTYLRKAPAFFPDAFIEASEMRPLKDAWTQPAWVSVSVPRDAHPGEYVGVLKVELTTATGAMEIVDIPLTLTVWPFAIPAKPSLRHTEWIFPNVLADYYHLEVWSEEHWTWMGKVAENMARHRQDMILVPLHSLVAVRRNKSGKLSFDFTRFDRYVRLFLKAGLSWLEGEHVISRSGDWNSPFSWNRFPVTDAHGRKIDTSRGAMSDTEFEPFVEALLRAVHAHLVKRGWLSRYVQHIGDEPVETNWRSWLGFRQKVSSWMPGVRTIDAAMCNELAGKMDIRVPQIHHVGGKHPRHPDEELWCYVCLAPQGWRPNRFLDYASLRNRIIFWICWSLRLKGFLHWGYNYWRPWASLPADVPVNPWFDATAGSIYAQDRLPLPAGDPHIVYPGRLSICDSLRWEVVRKGMEDFEILTLLEQAANETRGSSRDRAAAKRLVKRIRNEVAVDSDHFVKDEATLLAIREEAGELVARLGGHARSGTRRRTARSRKP
jgi:hypothetical protein